MVTWTDFESKTELDTWLASQDEQEVVEEGISADRAEQLAAATPTKCLLMAAVEDSCNKETGEVLPNLLVSNIQQILLMARMKKAA